METKNCTYRVNSGGEITSLTTSCTVEKRGGFSKISLTSGENNYSFLVGKNAVTLSTTGQTEYSFVLSEGNEQPFVIRSSGFTFNAFVSCKSLSITLNNSGITISSKYFVNISGNKTEMEFTLSVN